MKIQFESVHFYEALTIQIPFENWIIDRSESTNRFQKGEKKKFDFEWNVAFVKEIQTLRVLPSRRKCGFLCRFFILILDNNNNLTNIYPLRVTSHFLRPNFMHKQRMHKAKEWMICAFNLIKCRPRCLDNNTINYFNDSRCINVANSLLTFHFNISKLHIDWKWHRFNVWIVDIYLISHFFHFTTTAYCIFL